MEVQTLLRASCAPASENRPARPTTRFRAVPACQASACTALFVGVLVGAPALAVGLWLLGEALWFVATAAQAQGVVTNVRHEPVAYQARPARILFDPQQSTIEIVYTGRKVPDSLQRLAGSNTKILYRPGRPAEARIDTFRHKFGDPVLVLALGLGFLWSSWIVYALNRRNRTTGRVGQSR